MIKLAVYLIISMVKVICSIAYLLLFCLAVNAQTSIEEPFKPSSTFEAAKREASKNNKQVFIYFSGSDWCKPCIQFRDNIINTPEFTKFSAEHFIVLQADFPRLKKNKLSPDQYKNNEALAELYNRQGVFPWVVITDSTGNVILQTGYDKNSPEAFIAGIKPVLK